MSGEHPNLSLARDLICSFVEFENYENATENAPLMTRLDAGGDDVFKPLPGTNLTEICDNLQTVLRMASEPVALPASGRNREDRKRASQLQRERIQLFTCVCLALLGSGKQAKGA